MLFPPAPTATATHPPRPRPRAQLKQLVQLMQSVPVGLPARGRAAESSQLLEDVRLTEAGSVRAGSYSGGMKRRLSVAIALLGDPKVVYLVSAPTSPLGSPCGQGKEGQAWVGRCWAAQRREESNSRAGMRRGAGSRAGRKVGGRPAASRPWCIGAARFAGCMDA